MFGLYISRFKQSSLPIISEPDNCIPTFPGVVASNTLFHISGSSGAFYLKLPIGALA